MYKVLLLLAVVASAQHASSCPVSPTQGTDDCGQVVSSRIVGGQDAKQHNYPWQAAMLNSAGSIVCGGTLISKRHVLTASHCVEYDSANDITIRLGEHDQSIVDESYEQNINVESIFMHENYNGSSMTHDIAVIKLSWDANLDSAARPACLPKNVPFPDDGTTCTITGWGTLKSNGYSPSILQVAQVPIVNQAKCATNYSNYNPIDETMFCAAGEGIDTCQGDSGGPLVCQQDGKWFVHGATSWGKECAKQGYPGVYAKVKHFIDWIKGKMAL